LLSAVKSVPSNEAANIFTYASGTLLYHTSASLKLNQLYFTLRDVIQEIG